jgi:hypothetical protein
MSLNSCRPVKLTKRQMPLASRFLIFSSLLVMASARGAVRPDLEKLRDQCLYYAVGHAPADSNTLTLRHGLYAQSPFSPAGEVDLAASGFSLAALPAAVGNELISSNAAYAIAREAARQVRSMVTRSAEASTPAEIQRYGYAGILCHYPVWNSGTGEFLAQAGVELSTIDTTLLMYGLLVSANYFGDEVRTDYEAARVAIRWQKWLDTTSPRHRNQFHMASRPATGFYAWWDWYTQEAMLMCVFAAMSDSQLDALKLWRGWRRKIETYTSPGPDPKSFTCCATYFGDPFTVVYGLAFLDFARFPRDLDAMDWFGQGQTAYQANVEYFKKERGYLQDLTSGFSICAPNGVMAKPHGAPEKPIHRVDATLYTLAGGLPYYGDDPESNRLAVTLSGLLNQTPAFLGWHGWPAASVNATNSSFPVVCDRVIGQDISFIGLALDNYFTHRAQDLVLQDPAMRRTLNRLFPPQLISARGGAEPTLVCRGIPFTSFSLQQTGLLSAGWSDATNGTFQADGKLEIKVPGPAARFYRLETEPDKCHSPELDLASRGPS